MSVRHRAFHDGRVGPFVSVSTTSARAVPGNPGVAGVDGDGAQRRVAAIAKVLRTG